MNVDVKFLIVLILATLAVVIIVPSTVKWGGRREVESPSLKANREAISNLDRALQKEGLVRVGGHTWGLPGAVGTNVTREGATNVVSDVKQ